MVRFIFALMLISSLAMFPAMAQTPSAPEQDVILINNTVCPVSGMPINQQEGMQPVTVDHDGKRYNLCCEGCVEEFKKDPAKYSKIAEEEVARAQQAAAGQAQ